MFLIFGGQFLVRHIDLHSKYYLHNVSGDLWYIGMYENLSYSLKVYLAVVLLTYNKQQYSEQKFKKVLDIYIISHKVP